MKYRKKPLVIEAVQVHPETPAPGWLAAAFDSGEVYQIDEGRSVIVRTLEGPMRADVGDWIIKGIAGELYPCKPEIFAKTYEAVE